MKIIGRYTILAGKGDMQLKPLWILTKVKQNQTKYWLDITFFTFSKTYTSPVVMITAMISSWCVYFVLENAQKVSEMLIKIKEC